MVFFPSVIFNSFRLLMADCTVFAQFTTGRDLAFNSSLLFLFLSLCFLNIWVFCILCRITLINTVYMSHRSTAKDGDGNKL